MDLTREMMDRGWRRAPTKDVRQAWEEKGGRWQVAYTRSGKVRVDLLWTVSDMMGINEIARPVHERVLFDYCPEGWGDRPVPTEPGWWWRKDDSEPVEVARYDGRDGRLSYWEAPDRFAFVTDDGLWLAPCVRPGCHEARPEFPIAAPCRLY